MRAPQIPSDCRGPAGRGRAARLVTALLLALVAGCAETVPPAVFEEKAPGLEAVPAWLTFKCVKAGCDETLDVTVRELGTRRLAIKRVVLSEADRTDFELTSTLSPPAVMEGEFKVSVRYKPSGASELGDLKLLVTYADASPDDGEGRIPPGEISVPLLRRLVGEPVLLANPEKLVFGAVASGQTRSLPLTLSNAGFGNTSLAIAAIESDSPEIAVAALPQQGLAPEESATVQVTFAPTSERYSEAKLTVRTVDDVVAPVEILAVGTSLASPKAAVSPATGIDFGRVPKGTPRSASISLINRGGANLVVSGVAAAGNPNLRASLPEGATGLTLMPLESTTVGLSLSSESAGEIDGQLEIATNDPAKSTLRVPVTGMVTEPQAQATPVALAFGAVPQGWVRVAPISIRNAGWGALEVRALTLVLGSSNLFNLRSVPALPVTLERDQRLGLEVEFTAEALASFEGALTVESNDPNTPFLEVPISGQGVTCAAGCPLAHATPSCAGSQCSITSCASGWYDTDAQDANGCECAEPGDSDPGASCQEARDLGTFPDNGSSGSYTGNLAFDGDLDVLKFVGDDPAGGSYKVRVALTSGDPNIRFCVSTHKTEPCYMAVQDCPANLVYEKEGSGWSSDTAYYVVKVYRQGTNPAPACTRYTLTVSNGG